MVGTFFFSFFSGGKKDPTKNQQKCQRNLAFFGEKFWKSILSQGEFINTLVGGWKIWWAQF